MHLRIPCLTAFFLITALSLGLAERPRAIPGPSADNTNPPVLHLSLESPSYRAAVPGNPAESPGTGGRSAKDPLDRLSSVARPEPEPPDGYPYYPYPEHHNPYYDESGSMNLVYEAFDRLMEAPLALMNRWAQPRPPARFPRAPATSGGRSGPGLPAQRFPNPFYVPPPEARPSSFAGNGSRVAETAAAFDEPGIPSPQSGRRDPSGPGL
jgi:hypothetical protein